MNKPNYIVNTKMLAEIINRTGKRVTQLEQEGILVKRAPGKWELVENMRRYIQFLENGRSNRTTDNLETQKLQAEVDMKRAKADIADMQLKELLGEMHRSEDVEAITADMILTVRSQLLALPGRLAVDLSAMNNANEISNHIRNSINEILLELSNYQYNPDEYTNRVRERQGKSEFFEEEADE